MLLTTNKPLAAWGLVLHDPDLAEAILDRVLERGRLVELRSASYRTRHLKGGHPTTGLRPMKGPEYPEPICCTRAWTQFSLGDIHDIC